MRSSKLVLIVALVVPLGTGRHEGSGAEPPADKSEKTRTTTRELFQAAGHLYRFQRPVTLSSGAYRCLAEELSCLDDSESAENPALDLLAEQPTSKSA